MTSPAEIAELVKALPQITNEQIEAFRVQESACMNPADDFEGPRLATLNAICELAQFAVRAAAALEEVECVAKMQKQNAS